jgi:hypothetical protein
VVVVATTLVVQRCSEIGVRGSGLGSWARRRRAGVEVVVEGEPKSWRQGGIAQCLRRGVMVLGEHDEAW